MTEITPVGFAVSGTKLTAYLLNLRHPIGGPKARFFIAVGFDRREPERLAVALLDHCSANSHKRVETAFGPRFICDGPLAAPNGTTPLVRSVWQLPPGDDVATLITAYPL